MGNDIITIAVPKNLINEIKDLVNKSRQQAYAAVNQAIVNTYWQIGKRIVEGTTRQCTS